MRTISLHTLIGQPESETLEYKAVLPPSRTLAKLIAAFANTIGGVIILGVNEVHGQPKVVGLSEDFHAGEVVRRAVSFLTPVPAVDHAYHSFKDKDVYVIQVPKSGEKIAFQGSLYVRAGRENILTNPVSNPFNTGTYGPITALAQKIELFRTGASGALVRFLDHYRSVMHITADLKNMLYPLQSSIPTTLDEGKILMRIIFSSCADNFETYLSDLLYEIYLAKPETLKSKEEVTYKEVLDCTDIQEFIEYIAKKKLGKLRRGSVKGFLEDTPVIKDLAAISVAEQDSIERIFQIRHLYAHRNGIVDEKFLQFFPGQYSINDAHQMSLDDFLRHEEFLCDRVKNIEERALDRFSLATV